MSGSLVNDKYNLSMNFCILQAHQFDILNHYFRQISYIKKHI